MYSSELSLGDHIVNEGGGLDAYMTPVISPLGRSAADRLTVGQRAVAAELLPVAGGAQRLERRDLGLVDLGLYDPYVVVDVLRDRIGLGYSHAADLHVVDGGLKPFARRCGQEGDEDCELQSASGMDSELPERVAGLVTAWNSGQGGKNHDDVWKDAIEVVSELALLPVSVRTHVGIEAEALCGRNVVEDAHGAGDLGNNWVGRVFGSAFSVKFMGHALGALLESPLEADGEMILHLLQNTGVAAQMSDKTRVKLLSFIFATRRNLRKVVRWVENHSGTTFKALLDACDVVSYSLHSSISGIRALAKEKSLKTLGFSERAAEDHDDLLPTALLQLAAGGRDTSRVLNEAQIVSDARGLYEAGEGEMFTTQTHRFVTILCRSSPAHLAAVAEAYSKISFSPLIAAVKDEISGPLFFLFHALLEPAVVAAELVRDVLEAGESHGRVLAFLFARSDVELFAAIKPVYLAHFYVPLQIALAERVAPAIRHAVSLLAASAPKAEAAAAAIHERVSAMFVNDRKVVDLILSHDERTRVAIGANYRASYGVPLRTALSRRVGVRTSAVLAAMCAPRVAAGVSVFRAVVSSDVSRADAGQVVALILGLLRTDELLSVFRLYAHEFDGTNLLVEIARFVSPEVAAAVTEVHFTARMEWYHSVYQAEEGEEDDGEGMPSVEEALEMLDAEYGIVEDGGTGGRRRTSGGLFGCRRKGLIDGDGELRLCIRSLIHHAVLEREAMRYALSEGVMEVIHEAAPGVGDLLEALVDTGGYAQQALRSSVSRWMLKRWLSPGLESEILASIVRLGGDGFWREMDARDSDLDDLLRSRLKGALKHCVESAICDGLE